MNKVSYGETLMKEYLDILLPFPHMDNYRPDWLKNPYTGVNLELDRFYPDFNIAFEFNGEQHLRQVDGLGNIETQRLYDKTKNILAIRHKVHIVKMEAIDLWSTEMVRIIKTAMRKAQKLMMGYVWKKKSKKDRASKKDRLIETQKFNKNYRTVQGISIAEHRQELKDLGTKAKKYRIDLENTYGEQIGCHRRFGQIRKDLHNKYYENP